MGTKNTKKIFQGFAKCLLFSLVEQHAVVRNSMSCFFRTSDQAYPTKLFWTLFWTGQTLQGCEIARMVSESHFLVNSSLLDTKDVVENSKKSAVSWTFGRISTVTRAIPQKLTPVLSFPHVPQQPLIQRFSKFQPPSGGLPCEWWVLSGKFGVPICPNFPQYTPL